MNKVDLIQVLKDSNNLSKSEAEKIVALFFNKMTEALTRGDRVEIRGLCSFFVKEYGGYMGRNPRTEEKVKIKPKKLPFFQGGQGTEGSGGWFVGRN
jgi:integration host factor subunit beta